MNDSQPLILSQTFQGAIIALIGFVLQIFKVQIGNDELTTIITSLFTVIGIAMAIYGRIKATKTISGFIKQR